jgi:hypothetical protein
MKIKLFISFVLVSIQITAQLQPGFNPREAKELSAICNSFTYIELYGNDKNIIPSNYVKVYTSPDYGMDNKFQVYLKNGVGIINFRGSTDKKESWLENMYSAMIPVEDVIQIKDKRFDYKVGIDSSGAVHAGYVLAISYLADDVLQQMKALNQKGIYNFIITGHSKGGAIAQMMRAYLEYLPTQKVSKKNIYKVYAFANPMIGNFEFCNEYNRKFSQTQMSFLLHNPADMVPQMPMTYNDSTYWSSNVQAALFDKENFSMKQMLMDGAMQTFEHPLKRTSNFLGRNLNKQIGKELGEVIMPKYKNDINYAHTSKPIMLPPTAYPLELKDSSILEDETLMANYKRDANGNFLEKDLYKKQKWSLQHKPYNYYTAVLKVYFPDEYTNLDQKYFVMADGR